MDMRSPLKVPEAAEPGPANASEPADPRSATHPPSAAGVARLQEIHRRLALETAPESSEPADHPELIGPALGREFPAGVYLTVTLAYVWLLTAAWLAFGNIRETKLVIAIAALIFAMFLGLPTIALRLAWRRSNERGPDWTSFLDQPVDTWTGPLPAGAAWAQILIIPLSLAFAATLLGIVYRIVT